jgi:hypothetical protein
VALTQSVNFSLHSADIELASAPYSQLAAPSSALRRGERPLTIGRQRENEIAAARRAGNMSVRRLAGNVLEMTAMECIGGLHFPTTPGKPRIHGREGGTAGIARLLRDFESSGEATS